MLAERLARGCPEAVLLHDRRIPGSRANIDHIAIVASGIHVIDTKRYRGKVSVRNPLFGEARLIVAGRDRTRLIAGLERQVSVVQACLQELDVEVPVHGCLCFVAPEGLRADSGLPLLRTLRFGSYPLYRPSRLVKRLNASGPLDTETILRLHRALADGLPPATTPRPSPSA
jgi:hypothetical protein